MTRRPDNPSGRRIFLNPSRGPKNFFNSRAPGSQPLPSPNGTNRRKGRLSYLTGKPAFSILLLPAYRRH